MSQEDTARQSVKTKKGHESSVLISGMRDQDWKPYPVLLRGVDAFDNKHFLAPETSLRFVLRPQTQNIDMEQVRLRLLGDSFSADIPLLEHGVFVLPRDQRAIEDNAELVLNQKKGLFLWNLVALRSKGLQPNHRRVGDLRLTCEVFAAIEDWALLKKRYALRVARADEACESPRLTWTFYESQPIKTATVVSAYRRENLALTEDRRGFIIQLSDQGWDNQSLVQLEFEAGESDAGER